MPSIGSGVGGVVGVVCSGTEDDEVIGASVSAGGTGAAGAEPELVAADVVGTDVADTLDPPAAIGVVEDEPQPAASMATAMTTASRSSGTPRS